MPISRRSFVAAGSIAAAGILASPLRIDALSARTLKEGRAPALLPEAEMFEIAAKAVEACISAGATYADARLFRQTSQALEFKDDKVLSSLIGDREDISFGVRVLFNGAWGFAASPFPDMEEAVILASGAVEQAKANSIAKPEAIEWTKASAFTGSWTSPGVDPFSIPLEERIEFFNSWRNEVVEYRDGRNLAGLADAKIGFGRTETFLVTSEGTRVSQVRYKSGGALPLGAKYREIEPVTGPHTVRAKGISTCLGGWEVFTKAKLSDQIPELVELASSRSQIGVSPVDIGKYTIVFDGSSAGSIIDSTFARSTHLDIALGYEANFLGTSYLGPNVTEFLGTKVAHPSINIRADRSRENGLATVAWDDEGIKPESFDLVKDGLLVDYQTSRENVSHLKEWYAKTGRAVKSQGLAAAESGLRIQQQTTPNLELLANPESRSFDEMVSEIKRGYAFIDAGCSTSFNMREGTCTSDEVREIRDGKLGNFVQFAGVLFSTPELWAQVEAVGDKTTYESVAVEEYKGQPGQKFLFDVTAPALTIKELSVIDIMRKA